MFEESFISLRKNRLMALGLLHGINDERPYDIVTLNIEWRGSWTT